MFVFPTLLTIGLSLVAVPVLIHLINMLRHRRVRWAAMDFLLQSQRKHRRWIILKQLLLLLMRMAAVAAVALMLSQPVVRSQWSELLGAKRTHQIVLLDDSYSMEDRWGTTTSFDQAKLVVQKLAESARLTGGDQALTLLRFSRAAKLTAGSQPDLLQETVDSTFGSRLESLLGPMQPSQTSAGPAEALAAIDRLPDQGEDENRVIYIVSDFRARQWNDVTELRKKLEELRESGAKIQLVTCVDEPHANLAVAALAPLDGTQAAGVEMRVEVAVKNFGQQPARQVAVRIQEDGNLRPSVLIDEIPPGETVHGTFRANFPTAGPHRLTAALDADAVKTDNTRYWAANLPDSIPVLLVDGAREARDAFFLSAALAPGGKAPTGLRPRIEQPQFLRRHEELGQFAVIYLLNLPWRDVGEAEIAALENYVRGGGGVAFFLGELTNAKFVTDNLYRDGQGLFPAPLTYSTDLLVDRLQRSPDLEVTDHPMFSIFAGERNSFINTVMVQRYFAVPQGWAPPPDSGVKVIARLRNGAPFCLEKKFGDGKVIAMLSKVSPESTSQGVWNNWARNNPSFVVAMLEMQSYLAGSQRFDKMLEVGGPLSIALDPMIHSPSVMIVTPPEAEGEVVVDAAKSPAAGDTMSATLAEAKASGFYEVTLTENSGGTSQRIYACNAPPDEGDLRLIVPEQLRSRLEGIDVTVIRADDVQLDDKELAGVNVGDSILYLLLALLVGEQLLAYSASYHPPKNGGVR